LEQVVDLFFAQLDRQNAVLEAVVVENIGERRCDDAAEAVVQNRPWRVLAGRAAAEVGAGQQHFSALVTRFVQVEFRNDVALLIPSPFAGQELAEAASLDSFKEL